VIYLARIPGTEAVLIPLATLLQLFVLGSMLVVAVEMESWPDQSEIAHRRVQH
jgi:hypothetical protein